MAKYVGIYVNNKGKHDMIIVDDKVSSNVTRTIMSQLEDTNHCGLLAVIPLRRARVLARKILKD